MRIINSDHTHAYKLLGDDIVIAGIELTNYYKEVISDLEMEIQLTKTLESKDSFEFTKRFFKSGEEFSPLPLGELSYSTEQYWTISAFIHKMVEVGYKPDMNRLINVIAKHFWKGRKVEYMKAKIASYYFSVNPFKDGWDDNIDTQLGKWIKPHIWNLGCNTTTDFKKQWILQMYMKVQMEFIHETLITTVKNCQKWFNEKYFHDWRDKNGDEYHPLVCIIHKCIHHLNSIEYTNSSNAIQETDKFYKLKLSLKDFILFPKDIKTIYSKSGHQSKLKARAILNNRLEAYIKTVIDSEFSESFRG